MVQTTKRLHFSASFCIWTHCAAVDVSFDQDKAGAKPHLGTIQVKETVQEYIAGAETVSDDPMTRDYVVVRARLMAAKYVVFIYSACTPQNLFFFLLIL